MHLDHTWQPVKEYIKNKMKVNDDDKDDPVYFDEYEPDALLKIIDTQTKVTNDMKKEGKKKMFQVLIIIDEFADNPSSPVAVNSYTPYTHVVDIRLDQR